MERRPWPIVILAIIHFLEPFAKILFYSTLWNLPVSRFVSFLIHHTSPVEQTLFLASFPLGGICILAVKKWSLPGYAAVQAVTLAGHIYYHVNAPQAFPLYLIATLTLLNLSVVAYFLLPAVRLAYLDPSIRWWESKPRYLVDWKGKALQGKRATDLRVSNISEGGLFVTVPGSKAALEVNELIQVEFEFLETPMSLVGRIRHQNAKGTDKKYGIEFSELTPGVRAQLKRGIRELRRRRFPRQGRREETWQSFRNWIADLSTGKGFLPEPNKRGKKTTQVTVQPQPQSRDTGT